jgi:hypothetical protein
MAKVLQYALAMLGSGFRQRPTGKPDGSLLPYAARPTGSNCYRQYSYPTVTDGGVFSYLLQPILPRTILLV